MKNKAEASKALKDFAAYIQKVVTEGDEPSPEMPTETESATVQGSQKTAAPETEDDYVQIDDSASQKTNAARSSGPDIAHVIIQPNPAEWLLSGVADLELQHFLEAIAEMQEEPLACLAAAIKKRREVLRTEEMEKRLIRGKPARRSGRARQRYAKAWGKLKQSMAQVVDDVLEGRIYDES